MTTVTQIDGAPGAGKTHTLEEKLREEATDHELGPDEFWWLTFTRAGRNDVKPAIREVFPKADKVKKRAKTLHGLALKLATREGLVDHPQGEDPIITQGPKNDPTPYADFCARQGMAYDPRLSDPQRLIETDPDRTPTGNLLFAINEYLTQTCKDPKHWQSAPVNIPIPGDRVVALLERWQNFKRQAYDFRLFEHCDYVELTADYNLTPDARVLLIDEFQDFAPLEYRLFKVWRDSGALDRIYLAGDPNQSLYSFRGGTPHYFNHTDTDDRITLKTSVRCPQEVARVGNAVLSTHAETDPRGFEGQDPGGRVEWVSRLDEYELRDRIIEAAETYASETPAVMLLTRMNYQLRQLTNDLRAVGVPFEVLGTAGGIWSKEMRQMLFALNNWASGGQDFALPNVRKVAWHLPDTQERVDRLPKNTGGLSPREEIAPVFAGYTSAVEMAGDLKVKPWAREMLINAIEAPTYMEPDEVRAGTIHTAKGLEAPCVYLFTSTSERTVKRYSRDVSNAAEEHRVYYVGSTRASEELHLVEGYFDGPTAPPIRKIRHSGAVGA